MDCQEAFWRLLSREEANEYANGHTHPRKWTDGWKFQQVLDNCQMQWWIYFSSVCSSHIPKLLLINTHRTIVTDLWQDCLHGLYLNWLVLLTCSSLAHPLRIKLQRLKVYTLYSWITRTFADNIRNIERQVYRKLFWVACVRRNFTLNTVNS